MNKPYIRNGTPVGTESLCKTCTSALIFTGYRESEQMTMCTYVHPDLVLPFTVNTCSGYYFSAEVAGSIPALSFGFCRSPCHCSLASALQPKLHARRCEP